MQRPELRAEAAFDNVYIFATLITLASVTPSVFSNVKFGARKPLILYLYGGFGVDI